MISITVILVVKVTFSEILRLANLHYVRYDQQTYEILRCVNLRNIMV